MRRRSRTPLRATAVMAAPSWDREGAEAAKFGGEGEGE